MKHRFLAEKYWQDISTPMAEVDLLARKYPDLINLSLGDPDIITDRSIIETACQDAINGHTRYSDSQGDLELRQGIVDFYRKKYGMEIITREIMSVVGAVHGMFLVLQAVLNPGDEVIVHEPYFTPYDLQIKLAGGKPVYLTTLEEEGFQVDTGKLEGIITSKTKVIIINTPCNPTGACFSRKTLQGIADIARQYDLLVIADDVYGSFSYKEDFKPIVSLVGMKGRTVITGSFSKDFAMTGWRIGYVIGPEYIINTIRNINEGVCYSAPTISQRAALKALQQVDNIQPGLVTEYRDRVYYAYQRIQKIPWLKVNEPQGSFYLFVNIKKTGLSSTAFCKKMLEEAQILAIPGNAFGKSGEGYIRLACTVGIDSLKKAFDRLEKMTIKAGV